MKKFLAVIAIMFLVASCTTKKEEAKKTSDNNTKVETTKKADEDKKEETKKEKTEDKKENNILSKIIIIGSKECKICDEIRTTPDDIEKGMKANPIFAKVEIKKYDSSSEEAKKIMSDNEITSIPAILLDSNIIAKGQPADPSLKITKAGLYSVP
jgi:flagellum-specific peptidoglycan hydrolase FlgJ